MKHHRGIHKPFDDNERRQWQNPEAILSSIGLRQGLTFIDIGCGSGFFALPAARMVGANGKVYALDTSANSIAVLKEQAVRESLNNIYLTIGRAEELVLCEQCADIAFIGIALHDFQDPSSVLKNARRMLKSDGRLVNLDWKKEPMDLGPPLRIRFDEEMAAHLIEISGFIVEKVEDSGLYHYLVIAKP